MGVLEFANMNILIYNWRDIKHSWAGGGEVYVFEQASRWVKSGHTVTLFCGQDIDNHLPSYEKIQGIHVYRKGSRISVYFWAIWYYFSTFRKHTDIIVDVENGIPFFTPLFSTKPKICYVYHIHGNQFFYELPMGMSHVGYVIEKYIFPYLYKRVPIIAISNTTKDQLVRIGIPKHHISIVYSGIHTVQKVPSRSSVKFSHPTLLYLGRIKKYKRVDLLLHIFSEVMKRVPKAKLIIAGWGTEASHVTDLVMKSPLRRKINLMGPVSTQEKRQLLSKAWVFVNPSIGEGWSISVIEANLHGTPAAAFQVPGLTESIQHKKTGLLAQTVHELIDNICDILIDGLMRKSLSINAQKWARTFSWDRSAQESLSLIKRHMKKHTHRKAHHL